MDELAPTGGSQLPSAHHLKAALHAARVLSTDGTALDPLRKAYVDLPLGGVFYGADLLAGEQLLRRACLVIDTNGAVCPSARLLEIRELDEELAAEVLLRILLEEEAPLWIGAAGHDGELRPENIPEDAARLLCDVMPDHDRREALLLGLAQRYDDQARAALGLLGEEYVVAACKHRLRKAGRDDLVAWVRQVSRISDQLGYDVTERQPGGHTGRYEVKTTRQVGSLVEIHLSRNESRTGLKDPNWALVACRAYRDESVSIIGWCRAQRLRNILPRDSDAGGRWENAVLRLNVDEMLTAGLPPLS
jgi:hypothetical protein